MAAANAVTKMSARILPVGLDLRLAGQRFGDFLVRSPRKRETDRRKSVTPRLRKATASPSWQ